MTVKPRVKCPECGGQTRKKIGAGAGIIFKGSGFYETDYKRKSNDAKCQPNSPKPSETKNDKKTDSPKAD
jgi:predicted nucleic acid-binding Zn ribbon protein